MVETGIDLAIQVIRHAVQTYGDERTVIHKGIAAEDIDWLTGLLNLRMPPSYREILGKHDGVQIDDCFLYSIRESFDAFMILRHHWSGTGIWPVSTDECGNYYILMTQQVDDNGECPVAFIESIESYTAPAYLVASSYTHFCFFMANRVCTTQNDMAFVSEYHDKPASRSWPFDPKFVLFFDPHLEQLQSVSAWPK